MWHGRQPGKRRHSGRWAWLAVCFILTAFRLAIDSTHVRSAPVSQTAMDYVFVTDDRALAPPWPTWECHGGCDSVSVVDGGNGAEVFRPIGRISPGQLTTSSDGSLTIALATNSGSFLQVITRQEDRPVKWSSVILFGPPHSSSHGWQIGGPVLITADDQHVLVSTEYGFEIYATDALRRGVLGVPIGEYVAGSVIDPADFELGSDGTTLYIVGADKFVHLVDLRTLTEIGDPIAYSPVEGPSAWRVRRTFATLSPDNNYLVINGGNNNRGISVVDLIHRMSTIVPIPSVPITWGVSFNWSVGRQDLLAIHGGDTVSVVRFRGVNAPDMLARAKVRPVTDLDTRENGVPEHWRPGGVAWDASGDWLHASVGSSKIGKEWRSFEFVPDTAMLRERFDFDSCSWIGINPPQDAPYLGGAHGMPFDIITLNGRNRPTLTPTPSPTPSTTPTAPPSATPTAVAPPTSTPTPRPSTTAPPTPPATPTRAPVPIYLPIALREHCAPGVAPVDAVLVVDASLSMAGAKLAAAKAAAVAFIDALSPANDRVALVAFNEAAALLQPLAGDPTALRGAVAAIAAAPGTRIDRGLDVALGELRAARRPAPAVAVVILLTDGIQTVDADRPALLADGARAEGIDVWVVGLGGDVDAGYLRRVAGDADHAGRYVAAASADDLVAVYRDIARLVPCPAERYWGQR